MSRTDSAQEHRSSLGTLMRMAHAIMVEEYTRWLAGSPYKDIQPAHAAAIQPLWQRPEGVRLTELAQMARITKQSMGALVDSLEHGGYVERVDDPDDARAWRVRLTARGRQYGRDVRKFARETELSVANRLGTRRLEELRITLAMFVASSREQSPMASLPAKPD
jgi:DNA-binding MarR family transcriptional regulator